MRRARILSAIASALFAFAKWAWKQAHFALGAMITSLAGVFLAVALDTSPLVTAGLTATLGWSLFCSTEDLAWMHQRGYVSPAYVRLALTRLADKIGVSDADDYDARRVAEEEELAKLLEELERAPRNSDAKPPEWTADAMPGEKHKNNSVKTAEKTDAADDGISPPPPGRARARARARAPLSPPTPSPPPIVARPSTGSATRTPPRFASSTSSAAATVLAFAHARWRLYAF